MANDNRVRPLSEWTTDDGPVLWWEDDKLDNPLNAHIGTPLDRDADGDLIHCDTHRWWSPLPDLRPMKRPHGVVAGHRHRDD